MKWLDRLERKYSRYAIHNLMQYIVGGMAIVFFFGMVNPGINSLLGFSPKMIMQGQIWRVITFIFVPASGGFWIIFFLMILFFFGRMLEQYWGTFKFNIYMLLGSVGTMIASFILEAMYDVPVPLTNFNISMTLLLAVAQIAPDYEIRVMMILPVKLKYLSWIYGAFMAYSILFGSAPERITTFFSLLNFFIFFGPGIYSKLRRGVQKQQYQQAHRPKPRAAVRKKTANRPKNGEVIQVAFHCCEECGRTEVDDPTLEFRFCSKCEGHHEYCSDHIFEHEHKKEG